MAGIDIKNINLKKNKAKEEPPKKESSIFNFLNKDIQLFENQFNDKKKYNFYSDLTFRIRSGY